MEALICRVVPDEIDNMDNIMVQFSVREEELVEMLGSMQEKSVVQRARAAVQQSAKKEAGRTSGTRDFNDESNEDLERMSGLALPRAYHLATAELEATAPLNNTLVMTITIPIPARDTAVLTAEVLSPATATAQAAPDTAEATSPDQSTANCKWAIALGKSW